MKTPIMNTSTNRTASMTRLLWLLALALLLAPATAQAHTEEVMYYHTDAIGSVRMTTDATGAVVARYDYAPFGEEWPQQPPTPNPDVRQYVGKERDAETGLDYFGARYYTSGHGRFTTVDPVLSARTWIKRRCVRTTWEQRHIENRYSTWSRKHCALFLRRPRTIIIGDVETTLGDSSRDGDAMKRQKAQGRT